MSAAPRTLAICADDFGLNAAVSRGIAELAARGRLNAVSCLCGGGAWRDSARLLSALPADVALGLHFNLTEGTPVSAELRRHWPHLAPLPRLIAAAHVGRLPLAALRHEWRAQWQAFTDAVGRPPSFVDGHQHVHHLPGVRDVVLGAAASAAVAVRNTGHVGGPGHGLKRWLIERTGGRALQRRLRELGIAHNTVLLGVYGFVEADYRALMQRWLAAAPAEGGLLFCHPGLAPDDGATGTAGDPIAAARRREAAYLGSAAFADDLAAAGVTLGPAWRRRSSGG